MMVVTKTERRMFW